MAGRKVFPAGGGEGGPPPRRPPPGESWLLSLLGVRGVQLYKRLRRALGYTSVSIFVLVLGVVYYFARHRLLSTTHVSFSFSGLGLNASFNVPVRYIYLTLQTDKASSHPPPHLKTSDLRVSWSTNPALWPAGARLASQVVDRGDGSYILRYRLRDDIPANHDLIARLSYVGKIDKAVFLPTTVKIPGPLHGPSCPCPVAEGRWTAALGCPDTFTQLERDFEKFPVIDLERLREEGPTLSRSDTLRTVVHYVIKDNQIFRRHFGPLPAFQFFADLVLIHLANAVQLPDVEFFLNIGDWPVETRKPEQGAIPVFSWSGSTDTSDIVLPQWDVAKTSTLGFSKSSSPDLLSIQEDTSAPLSGRIQKAIFRGRDSNLIRVKLALLAKEHPDLLDVAITSWENDAHADAEKKLGGGSKSRVPLERFRDYKYQLLVDGSVAAYRTPYLFMSGSVLLKHDSPYYEWFYADIEPMVHYIPFKSDLSDIIDRLKWAEAHPDEAQAIADRAQTYARENLTPDRIFCYYYRALAQYASRQKGVPTVTPDMVRVEPPAKEATCACPAAPPQETKALPYPLRSVYPSTVATLGEAGQDVVLLSYSSFCNRSSSYMPKFLKTARLFIEKRIPAAFAICDGHLNHYPPLFSFCNYRGNPRLLYLKNGQKIEGDSAETMKDVVLTGFNTVQFVNDHVAPEYRLEVPEDLPETMSQPIPKDNNKPVKIVVANNFDEMVLNGGRDVLLEVYAPWCGHCKSLKPVYEEFARLVASSHASGSLTVAKMNGAENSLPYKQFTWTGYPTIWFIKAGSRTPLPFVGPRTVRGLYDFVQKHATKAPLKIDGVPAEIPFPAGSGAAKAVDSTTFERLVLNADKVGLDLPAAVR
ncbi:protein disulfide-isomerase domain-containing [Cystoisospora suis]|uniref:Protein disulfide-isomerase domain-containing n=1 Tax=Cystoisospora suis TaxID=483139 RepID=A0A2C6KEP9_9APIC|nr:protein disulfide-isomerase domain-containing [Cystoisospora suis]